MFSQPVVSVDNTQMFARHSAMGTQFLVYQMTYESQDLNAMVLPLPIKQPASDASLRFIDLRHYEDFFRDLDKGFPWLGRISIGCSAGNGPDFKESLQVFKIGNYIASFVPTLSDFDRVDSQFKLSDDVWSLLPQYKEFGFAVFRLAAGALKPHPMAFEFQTSMAELFFPSVHVHDGEVHDRECFDHVLYMQHAGLDSVVYNYQNADWLDENTGLIRSNLRASQFCSVEKANGLVLGDLLVHRKFLSGELENEDMLVQVHGDPIKTNMNLRPFLYPASWLAAFTAIGWFFRRRTKVRAAKKSQGDGLAEQPTPNRTMG